MSGLLSALSIAVSGLNVSQDEINVTSHNVSNASTGGYSRQRLDVETASPQNNLQGAGQLGSGVKSSEIERIRDVFIDYQIRNEESTYGNYTARNSVLSDVENVFNEPSTGTGLSTIIGNFFDSWTKLSKQPQSPDARTVVYNNAASLATELNHEYSSLSDIKENIHGKIKDDIFSINDALDKINNINQEIMKVKTTGQNPNDLLDTRDGFITDLSTKFGITLNDKSFDGVDLMPNVEDTADKPSNSCFVKAEYSDDVKRLSYIDNVSSKDNGDGTYTCTLTYYKLANTSNASDTATITVKGVTSDELKELDENRILWADKDGNAIQQNETAIPDNSTIDFSNLRIFKPQNGELKGYTSLQNDIDSYIDEINKVAKAVAFSVNAVESGRESATGFDSSGNVMKDSDGNPIGKDAEPFFVNSDKAQYDSNYKISNLSDTLGAEKDITAANISVSEEIIKHPMEIKVRTHDDKYDDESQNTDKDGATDGERAEAIGDLKDALMMVGDMGETIKTRSDLFDSAKGGNALTNNMTFVSSASGMTIGSYFKDVVDELGVQGSTATRNVKNEENSLSSLTKSQESVSGVSLDEEFANLIQYEHGYQANAKVISTVDELLDVVINGLIK